MRLTFCISGSYLSLGGEVVQNLVLHLESVDHNLPFGVAYPSDPEE